MKQIRLHCASVQLTV